MTPTERANKEVEVAEWLKKKGYARKTWKAIAPVIVQYLADHKTVKPKNT